MMLRTFFLWVSVCLVIAASSPVSKDGEGSRIFNGIPANEGDFPFAVSLQEYSPDRMYHDHVCTLSLITTTTCLGAAHCLFHGGVLTKKETFCGIVGSLYQYPDTMCHRFKDIHYHKEYDNTRIKNDISTFIFKEEMILGVDVQIITLAGPNLRIAYGQGVISLGWGITKSGGDSHHRLLFVNMKFVMPFVCGDKSGDMKTNQICIYDKNSGDCKGDSGGPFVIRGIASSVQIGIASFIGLPGCVSQPTVGTDVRRYKDWIIKNSEGGLIFTD